MDANLVKPPLTRRRRRHTEEFKAQIVAACLQPGISTAAIALANGLNTNLVRLWVKGYRENHLPLPGVAPVTERVAETTTLVPVALQDAGTEASGNLRLDLRRGPLSVQLSWPVAQAAMLGQWLKDLLQ